MKVKQFFEFYWQTEHPPPEVDSTVPHRARFLETMIRRTSGESHDPSALTVLDAGCGSGIFARQLRGMGHKVIAVDFAERAARNARTNLLGVNVAVGALEEQLPLISNVFDVVWCSEVLAHLFDVCGALQELNRVLKMNGLLIVTTPYHGLLKNLSLSLHGFDRHFNPRGNILRFFSPSSLKECLESAGFEAQICGGCGRSWPLYRTMFATARKRAQSQTTCQMLR
jgi:2-polyprenyl-3-methyl-5-hydroxy-6-metoxy-1,4-benzoquinol methylase